MKPLPCLESGFFYRPLTIPFDGLLYWISRDLCMGRVGSDLQTLWTEGLALKSTLMVLLLSAWQ